VHFTEKSETKQASMGGGHQHCKLIEQRQKNIEVGSQSLASSLYEDFAQFSGIAAMCAGPIRLQLLSTNARTWRYFVCSMDRQWSNARLGLPRCITEVLNGLQTVNPLVMQYIQHCESEGPSRFL
jgi:hypothetical protein